MGTATDTLLRQRRAVAAATAPAAGGGGQDLDISLALADESGRGQADPAFAAHAMPIGQWATAVWERWLPIVALTSMAVAAKRRTATSRRVWAACVGPGGGIRRHGGAPRVGGD